MTRVLLSCVIVFVSLSVFTVAQESCEQEALASIDQVRVEYEDDVSTLFAAMQSIEEGFNECRKTLVQAELSPREIVEGGHIVEGLWTVKAEYTWSDVCEERRKTETDEYFEDVHYNDDGLLTWDGGNNYSNFVFEYLLTRRYARDDSGHNWVQEREITSATPTSLSGTYTSYWQGNKHLWCSLAGTFTAELVETQNACLVVGVANIRTNPSTKSPINGKIEDQRLVIDKVLGDDNYHWWKLSDDEYIREDVVGSSRSCERL